MSAAASRSGALRFHGSPLALSAVADSVPTATPLSLHVTTPLATVAARVHVKSVAAEGPALLRVALPRSTPPGTYHGVVRVGDQERDVDVAVEPDPFLRFVPDRLTLVGAPEAHVPVTLTVVNLGNVAVALRASYAFGLYEAGSTDLAIGRAFGSEHKAAESRIDRLVDALAESYGGQLRVKVTHGAGDVTPGASREVRGTATLPSGVRAGVTYWGHWPMDYARYYVRVEVAS
jgi:hypothetical protein